MNGTISSSAAVAMAVLCLGVTLAARAQVASGIEVPAQDLASEQSSEFMQPIMARDIVDHDLLGMWVSTRKVPMVDGTSGWTFVEGFSLQKGGVAKSIGTATLLVRHWHRDGNRLVLRGRSAGNGSAGPFASRYQIVNMRHDKGALRLQELDEAGKASGPIYEVVKVTKY